MGFEEMKRLRDEAKESQVRKPLDSVSAPGAETNQTNQPKEVARTIADKAKKIGKKKKQCQCCQMSAKCSIKIFSRSIAKVLIWIRQNISCRLKERQARPDTPGPLQLWERGDRGCGVYHKARLFHPHPYQPPTTVLSLWRFYILIENLFCARF